MCYGYDFFKTPVYKPAVPESNQVAERYQRLKRHGIYDKPATTQPVANETKGNEVNHG